MAPWGQGRDMEGLLTPGPHRPGRPASSQSMAGSEMGKSRVVGADCSNTGVRGHAGMDHLAHPEDRPRTQRDRKTNKGRGRDGIGQAREGQADDQGACEGLQGQVGGPKGIYQRAWPGPHFPSKGEQSGTGRRDPEASPEPWELGGRWVGGHSSPNFGASAPRVTHARRCRPTGMGAGGCR